MKHNNVSLHVLDTHKQINKQSTDMQTNVVTRRIGVKQEVKVTADP